MGSFSDEFVRNLPADVHEAIIKVDDHFWNESDPDHEYDEVMEAFYLVRGLLDRAGHDFPSPDLSHTQEDTRAATAWLNDVARRSHGIVNGRANVKREQRFGQLLGTAAMVYEFSESDFERMQDCLNSLRNIISKSEEIEERHRQRLLRRLEALQAELHKRMSDIDRIWGFVIEASIVIRQVGENLAPAAKVVKDIMDIVWRIVEVAQGLPPGTMSRGLSLPAGEPREDDE
ncbi:MAG: hypothetical protein ACQGVC_23905 [Myxococcota bacterium]